MNLKVTLSSLFAAGLLLSCGKRTTEVKDALNGYLTDPTGDVASNLEALAEHHSDTLDEIASSLNESGSGGSESTSSLALAPSGNSNGNQANKEKTVGAVKRTCTVDSSATPATVTVLLSYVAGQKDQSTKKGRIQNSANAVTAGVSGTGTLKRVWTPASAADAACTNSAHFKMKDSGKTGADLNGTSLLETEDRTRDMSVTKGGRTLTSRKMKTTGTRQINFSAATNPDYTYQKTVNNNITRTVTLTKPNGGTVERVNVITHDVPNTVLVKRNSTTGNLEKKVITAGKIKSVNSTDAIKVETEFENLTYSFVDNDNPCTPTGGKIKGKTYKSDVEVKSYTIDFGADLASFPSGISLTLGTDAAKDCPTCVSAKCDFE
ncbi:MAG: hypothetical protein EBR09_08950 [Proteobacteria bacterium]|nr:hypothetical protein [Pseudomonadota bacterium]